MAVPGRREHPGYGCNMQTSSLCVLIGLLILVSTSSVIADQTAYRVTLLSSGESVYMRQAVAAIRSALDEACPHPCKNPVELSVQEVRDADQTLPRVNADLVVAVGTKAAEVLAGMDTVSGRLFGMIPCTSWQRLSACCDQASSAGAIFIDQPPSRYFQAVRAIRPGARRIGVLLSEVSQAHRQELIKAAEQADLELHFEFVERPEHVGSRLRRLVDQVDALLALPDPTLYNRTSIYSVLLTAYSARMPLVAYSDAMVRAGAAVAIYMSPDDIGHEMADQILAFRENGVLTRPRHGRQFSVCINAAVLRALRLTPLSERELLQRIENKHQ